LTVASPGIDWAGTSPLAFEALPSGVLIVDAEGTIALVNRELERLFGYTRAEVVGQNIGLLLPEASPLIDAARRAEGAHAPSSPSMGADRQILGRRKDGTEIPVEIGLRPVQIADGLFVLASIVDTTERDQLERVRQAALEEQLEFERFVAELSGRFINLPADRIDEAIRGGLARICEQLGLDRGSFYKVGPDGLLFDCVGWTAPGIPPVDGPMPGKERLPWAVERILAGEVVSFSTRDDVPSDVDRASYAALGVRSAVILPLSVDGRVEGAVGFNAVRAERTWPPEVVHRLSVIAGVFGQLLARRRRDEALKAATDEAQRLKEQLQTENVYLRREARERLGPTRAMGQGAAVRRVLEQIEQVAATDSTVLLLGETGTGKELFATQIHELSARRGRAMVRVNCAAIPATLIESELFGREKGAFTGALARQVGRFELADHSTIFLDEIGDLPPDVQVKLLRVLEERQIERLGSPRPITVDTRIIAATHRNLEQRIADGAFREDLYYRLSVFPIHVPPLRERVEDIPLLVWGFVEEFSKAFGKRVDAIDRDNLTALQQYAWPGNIRELRNVVERAMIGATGRRLSIPLPQATPAAARRSPKLVDVEKEHIRAVLEGTGWRIRGAAGAAERLGLKPTTLETRMAKLGLRRPGHS
jgi:formate hydrogenlyase transcriptional activator